MTATEQRIVIAKWLGWRELGEPIISHDNGEVIQWWSKYGEEDTTRLPDFLNDLNAVHAAEKVLQDKCKYWPDYVDELSKIFPFSSPNECGINWSQMCHATAAQRAEALLRAIGRWKD